ncbi:MAG TPA: ATPase, T2SS/T4P/T4SS family [Longimicrobiales bacterium]
MPEPTTRVLGQLLLADGVVDAAELAGALDDQRRTRERLGAVLVRRGLDARHVARALARQLRLAYAEPPLAPDRAALAAVDRGLAARLRVLPLAVDGRTLRVAMADPLDTAAVDDLQFQTGRRVEPVVTTPRAVAEGLAAAYGVLVPAAAPPRPGNGAARTPPAVIAADAGPAPGNGDRAVAGAAGAIGAGAAAPAGPGPPAGGEEWAGGQAGAHAAGVADEETGALVRASEAAPIVALVEQLLVRAVAARASDLHVEPAAAGLRVRARVDGALRELAELPAEVALAVVSRLKIIAGLDISVKRRPQDGRAALGMHGRELALRVSTLPCEAGEKVVIRFLDPQDAARRLEDLGFAAEVGARFLRLLGRGHGVILVTGPTGSGKTTTLYAALGALDRDRLNITTLEDPVEYRLPGLTQVQVHARAGLTFAAALRAVLRQDPDVVMVGEMRDRETVEVGMAAALTGHLVLSTLHTNDAPGAIARLAEMGAPAYLVAGGLIGVLAQRLARRLCPHCREPYDADAAELAELGLPARPVRLHRPRGCAQCEGTGYRGRIGIHELLVVDARIRELILRRAAADLIRDAARAAGMETLGQDAWNKVRAGLTSLAEVRPLLTLLADEAPLCPACGHPLAAGFLHCAGCGRPLRPRCRCGATLEAGWRCCPACGAPRPPDHGAPAGTREAAAPAPSFAGPGA